MSHLLNELQKELADALSLLNKNEGLFAEKSMQQRHTMSNEHLFLEADSLLKKCDQVVALSDQGKPKLRIIHHFACSGGTLVSKCLSAMPNVFLLSEVHPHSELQNKRDNAQYSPSDLSKLAIYSGIPEQKKLAEQIFVDSVKSIHQHVESYGGTLILRDHTHSDYCVGEVNSENTVVELLKDDFEIISLVTLRNPIDSYLSLVSNGWVHFEPQSFDEYCARLLIFLSHFKEEQIVFYENFVDDSQLVVKIICDTIKVPFSDFFDGVFDVFSVTGDSGRKSSVISSRKRRSISDEHMSEIIDSDNFKKLCHNYAGFYQI